MITLASCSYQHASTTATTPLKRCSVAFHFHTRQRLPPTSRIVHAQRYVLHKRDSTVLSNEEKNSAEIIKAQNLSFSVTFSQTLPSKREGFQLSNNNFHPFHATDSRTAIQSKMKNMGSVHFVDKESKYGRLPGVVSPYLDNNQNHSKEHLKIAPTTGRNVSTDFRNLPSPSIPIKGNATVGQLCPGGGESSCMWESEPEEFKEAQLSGNVTSAVEQKVSRSPIDNLGNIFRAFYNNHWCKEFLARKSSYFGKGAMSLSLLLEPIVGSPPSHSNLSSPCNEARDDISALSDGFKGKKKILRRRLSTSFDAPSHCDAADRTVASAAGNGNVIVEHAGPFGFRSSAKKLERTAALQLHDLDNEDKKAKLNAWLSKIHEEAIVKSNSPSGDGENDSKSDDRRGSSSSRDDDDDGKSSSASSRVTEDMFQLLENVIGYKGRNISHIIIEKAVKDLCTVYMDAPDDDKLKFLTILAEKYGVDHDNVSSVATSLASSNSNDVDAKLTLEEKLRAALVPKSQWLFTQIGRLVNGVKFLVDMRTDLLDAIEKSQGKSSLKALNNSLRDLIAMWFNVGFLAVQRVTWSSSCEMLQKISEYEAVHPMRNWTDLKKRVGPNRRCFVYTHNSMPGEPVVVLHTFLTDHIPSSVQKIVANHRMRMMSLDSELPLSGVTEDPDFISTAVFYSITSTQRGLTGIELGNYLIKRVVRELQSEFPKMTQYSSLSPIPGFKNWLTSSLKNELKESNQGKPLLTEQEISGLKPLFERHDAGKKFYEVFLNLLKVNSWFSDEQLVKELEKPLMRLCAQYLFIVKRRGYALDPVAHFHLKNGAVMWRLNWLGDDSPRGLGQSCGMMVNYRYFLDACETNSQNYMENQLIQTSDQVKHLVKLTEA